MRKILSGLLIVTFIICFSLHGAYGEGIVITISGQVEEETLPYENQAYLDFHTVGEKLEELGNAVYNAYALQILQTAYQYYDSSKYAYPYINALQEGCALDDAANSNEIMIAYGLLNEYSVFLNGSDYQKSLDTCDIVEQKLAYTQNECVRIIWVIFENRGYLSTISDGIETGKTALKQADNNFRYYEQLKVFYSTLKNYYEFLLNPSVTLIDMKDKIEQYNQTIEECENILAFEFE